MENRKLVSYIFGADILVFYVDWCAARIFSYVRHSFNKSQSSKKHLRNQIPI